MSANQQIAFENLVTQIASARRVTRQQAIAVLVGWDVTPESMPR